MTTHTVMLIGGIIALLILLWPMHTSTQAAIAQLGPGDFYRESALGYSLSMQSSLYTTANGGTRGIPLNKFYGASGQGTNPYIYEYYSIAGQVVPLNVTITTGLTWKFTLVDDGQDSADLGKVVVLEVTPFNLSASGALVDYSVAGSKGTVTTANVTLSSTTGNPVVGTIAIVAANLASLASGNIFGFRFRRKGDASADTCNGRVLCTGCLVYDT